MRYVIVGSEARKLGKTSLICRLIQRSPEIRWTAVKITAEPHLAAPESFEIREELRPGPTDSGRFLQAGAARSFFVQARPAGIRAAMDSIESRLREPGPIVLESTSAFLEFGNALTLMILAPGSHRERKELAQLCRQRADVFVCGPGIVAPAGHIAFEAEPPDLFSAQLVEHVLRYARGAS